MLKFGSARKNKVDLNDYDYQLDIENRLLLSQISTLDIRVLEEILLSSLTSTLPALARALKTDVHVVAPIVQKFAKTGLLKQDGESFTVDKERRRYYEFQIRKFDEDFKPNLQYAQDLLTKVPIHVLPQWYSIPRASANIFESIVEKYLLTPRVFQRYLLELNLGNSTIEGILQDVYSAPDFIVKATDLRQKYDLNREEFEEYMLHLEFNFLCFISYVQADSVWEEVVTPLHEWRQHLRYLRDTMPEPIQDSSTIAQTRPGERAFIHDFLSVLSHIQNAPLNAEPAPPPYYFRAQHPHVHPDYLSWQLYKLHGVGLIDLQKGQFVTTQSANEWLQMDPEEAALLLYRHHDNPWRDPQFQQSPRMEREFRELERSLERISNQGWIRFNEFIKGVLAPVRGSGEITLQRVGRRWAYTRPTYTPEQVSFIRDVIFERFFEAGFVEIGSIDDQTLCFRVTPFGKSMIAT